MHVFRNRLLPEPLPEFNKINEEYLNKRQIKYILPQTLLDKKK
mgnify:CR=1 FL=1